MKITSNTASTSSDPDEGVIARVGDMDTFEPFGSILSSLMRPFRRNRNRGVTYTEPKHRGDGHDQDRLDRAQAKRVRRNHRNLMEVHRRRLGQETSLRVLAR